MISIASQELKRRKWSMLWWIIGIGAFIALVLAVYPTFRDSSGQELDKTLQQIPTSAKSFITDTSDYLSPIGYLSSQMYYLVAPMLFAFLSIGLGSSLLAREEQNYTIELLLARPVSRTRLLFEKATAGLIVLLAVGVATGIIGGVLVSLIGFAGVHAISVLWVTLMCVDFALLFGALAFALTAAGRLGRGASIGISTLIALGSYIISSLAGSVHWLSWPAKLLPFHYYHPADILGGKFTAANALGMLGVTAVLMFFAWLAFRRRDIE